MSGFTSTCNKGFRIEFENGWTLSVQFGPMNYCDHYDARTDFKKPMTVELWSSTTAETAIINPKGEMIEYQGDSVQARQTPSEVAALIVFVILQPKA